MSTTPAELIRESRLRAGLTQRQLAARLGVTQPTIAALERPGSNPRYGTLRRALLASGEDAMVSARSLSPVDETQLLERLRLTPAERLATFHDSQRALRSLTARARRVA